jgi:hypothetical protein
MKPNQDHPQTALYLLLLAIQISGAVAFVWQELPDFRHVLRSPGEQLSKDASSDLMTAGILFLMQASFWYRLLRIPDSFSAFEHLPQSPVSVSRPPQFHFWQRVIFGRRVQASSGARPRYRPPSDGPTRIAFRRLPVRAVL